MTRDPYLCRFPRTLQEAFPCDAMGACAITRYRAPRWPRVLLLSIFALGLVVGIWRLS